MLYKYILQFRSIIMIKEPCFMWVRYFKSLRLELTCLWSACTLIRIKTVDNLKAGPVGYCPVHCNKYPRTERFITQHAYTMNHGPTAICHSSDKDCFVMWTQGGQRFREDKLCVDRTFHSWYILLFNDLFIIVINLQSPSVTVTRPPNMCPIIKNKEW
jgi:hypothetical protein